MAARRNLNYVVRQRPVGIRPPVGDTLSPGQAAERVRVSAATIRRALDMGDLAYDHDPERNRVIASQDVDAWARARGLILPIPA